MTNPLLLWQQIQVRLKEKIGDASFETWFSPIKAVEKNSTTLVLEAPDDFFKSWIVDHYLNDISAILSSLTPTPIDVLFEVNADLVNQNPSSNIAFQPSLTPTPAQPANLKLNHHFTFENFVIGPSNRFAAAAGMAVAESPARAYNPLFIYGEVGLGKTHLLQAITLKTQKIHSGMKVCYMSSEMFTNELIDSIRHRSTVDFRKKYRNIDVLLIDDIQFIAGKESTQEEFFHTFNALHDNRKQIIITSDRPPKEISNLEERLSSRFAWGLITDIQPPDFETRVAILKKRVENVTVPVPDDVVYFIADQIKTNIRELEGALNRVAAYSMLEDKALSLAVAKVVLKDMVKETSKIISIEMVQKTVANYYQIPLSELRAKRRNKNIVLPRQIAMYLARQLTHMSLPEIGNAFGGKDHTTVLHSCKKIEDILGIDKEIKNALDQLTIALQK